MHICRVRDLRFRGLGLFCDFHQYDSVASSLVLNVLILTSTDEARCHRACLDARFRTQSLWAIAAIGM